MHAHNYNYLAFIYRFTIKLEIREEEEELKSSIPNGRAWHNINEMNVNETWKN